MYPAMVIDNRNIDQSRWESKEDVGINLPLDVWASEKSDITEGQNSVKIVMESLAKLIATEASGA